MNDNSSTNESQHKLLSEDQMDSLLRDFFRLEVPIELNQPLQFRSTAATSAAVVVEHEIQPTRSRSVPFVAVVASVAAMAMAVLVAISAGTSSNSDGSRIANGLLSPTTNTPTTNTPDIEKPMLVSPQGDSSKSPSPIGFDGVTLEETDSIQLHPQK